MIRKRRDREQEQLRAREEEYARKRDLEELERRVARVEARVRVLQSVVDLEHRQNGDTPDG